MAHQRPDCPQGGHTRGEGPPTCSSCKAVRQQGVVRLLDSITQYGTGLPPEAV